MKVLGGMFTKGRRLFTTLVVTQILAASLLTGFSWVQLANVPNYAQGVSDAAKLPVDPALSVKAKELLAQIEAGNSIPSNRVQQIEVVNSKEWNAATDGKTIFFTDSLWNALQTNDQRAFVISHELSHILLGHVKKTQYRRIALSAFEQLLLSKVGGGKNPNIQKLEDLSLNLIDLKFSRGQEFQADDLGFQIMTKGNFNAKGAIEAFEILQKGSSSHTPEFLQSHPVSASRIRVLSQKYKTI
ncbi:MAG: M48 family metallopeptidase [Cyanobacteria bacterium]|nr:M48 family metallopeptidase [Cyanobacteriota bacterium]